MIGVATRERCHSNVVTLNSLYQYLLCLNRIFASFLRFVTLPKIKKYDEAEAKAPLPRKKLIESARDS